MFQFIIRQYQSNMNNVCESLFRVVSNISGGRNFLIGP